jgi:hypothetical protein
MLGKRGNGVIHLTLVGVQIPAAHHHFCVFLPVKIFALLSQILTNKLKMPI